MTGWRKSTKSSQGSCVEVASDGTAALVRDSKDPQGPVLGFAPAAWARFTGRLKAAG